ncbi:MAG: HyaD/HybD family hydrogenase maturation endopeptidase [Selenomonadaceae bacterium]|nr:HyaD/HybD family hydrogenase maturation endopeptidase [Selenomonadaceae bacterium]
MNGLYTKEITVLGVGNLILTDEGFGVHVINYLNEHYEFPDNVQLVDGGTLGMELTHFITGTKRLLIVDAVDGGLEPGMIYRLSGDELKAHFRQKISAHEVGIEEVLTLLELTGRPIDQVIVLGAQPFDMNAGVGLSEGMEKILPTVVERAIEILHGWGVDSTIKMIYH